MIYRFFPILFAVLFFACMDKSSDKPVWINQSKSICLQKDSIVFTAKGQNWQAVLYTFTQPVPLKIQFTNTGFALSARNKYGITEGSALLILNNKKQKFLYHINLHNDSSGIISYADLRSPKTVNPDSSLMQHRMVHQVDEWRNIIGDPIRSSSFFEEEIQLKPVAGTYRAQKDKAISAFYVQPGSATSIPLRSEYIQNEKQFKVIAGPLKDYYNNLVSNGTNVAFVYNDDQSTYRMEAAVVNGFAFVKIPFEKQQRYNLTARINDIVSKQLILKR